MTRTEALAKLEFTPVDRRKEFRELMRPGAVVKTKDGDLYVVGDVNELGGRCDCCKDLYSTDIAAIAYLWEQDPQ